MGKRSAQPARRPVSRRDFLAVGGLSVVGFPAAERAAKLRASLGRGPKAVVLVLMNGGASAFETFDPKPAAPKELRGPYRAIETAVPGVHLSESLPRLAERAKKFSLVRSLYHQAAPIHETGLQLLQTGGLGNRRGPRTAFGARLHRGDAITCDAVPAYVVTPARLTLDSPPAFPFDGVGEDSQCSEPAVVYEGLRMDAESPAPVFAEKFETQPYEIQDAYGHSSFGRTLWNARQLVEYGASWVTVNLCETLVNQVTWDAHGTGTSPATVQDYGRTLCPKYDRAMAGFLDDLEATGLWNDVIVICTGEMGRTPRINRHGGRDHWTGNWSALVAGGSVPGGQVVGQTSDRGDAIADTPVAVESLTAAAFKAASGGPHEEAGETVPSPLAALNL